MKVYIVTSGEYSDYCIEAVFLEEEKAKMYCKLNCGFEYEERETKDEDFSMPEKTYWNCEVFANLFEGEITYEGARFSSKKKAENSIVFFSINRYVISVDRSFPSAITEKQAIGKTKKILYDVRASVLNMLDEGADFADINRALSHKKRSLTNE